MAWFRATKKLDWHDQRGTPTTFEKGQIVDVLNRHDVDRLLSSGLIVPMEYSARSVEMGDPAPPFTQTRRIGIWLVTTNHYSGGRIHMYQYALSLAELGAEVWLITGAHPRWAADFPSSPLLHIAIEGKDPIPADLDLIVTDSKHGLGKKALDWKRKHARIPFCVFNFETPNWVRKYDPAYAAKLQPNKEIFRQADLLIANSRLSLKFAVEWLGRNGMATGVVNPAVNTHALKKSASVASGLTKRPFALYSARPAGYKGGDIASDAIWGLDVPFDLVVFGELVHRRKNNDLHKLHQMKGVEDAKKFAMMRDAHFVIAPSLFEGYGMVPGEAMAAGTPVVVYDLPVLRDAYGDAPVYVPWKRPKEFVQKVREMARAPKQTVPDAVVERMRTGHGLGAMKRQIQKIRHHAIRRPSVSAHMILFWGFVPEALESIYPHVDEIQVAYGPTKIAAGVSPDGSLERLRAFPDPDGKISIETRDVWADKKAMRSFCTDRAGGNYMLMLDADEIWVGLDRWIEKGYAFNCPRWINFWHGGEFWVHDSAKLAGLRWGKRLNPFGSVCPHLRWSWWRPSYRWRRHPMAVDMNDRPLHKANNSIIPGSEPSCSIYHLGHALPRRIMRAKHQFYLTRDGNNPGRRKRQTAWERWSGKPGDCGDGIIRPVDWKLPDIVRRGIASLQGLE